MFASNAVEVVINRDTSNVPNDTVMILFQALIGNALSTILDFIAIYSFTPNHKNN